jgi:flagellar assembly protein FliH
VSNFKVEEFSFQVIDGDAGKFGKVESFTMQEIDGTTYQASEQHQGIIRKEREKAYDTMFEVEKVVEEHRGLKKQAKDDFERKVEAEVHKRIQQAKEVAYKEGFEKGHADGHQKAYTEATGVFSTQIQELENIIHQVQENREEVFLKNRLECYEIIRGLTKWVLLKEIEKDEYMRNLLEKLILEMGTRTNLLIRVNKRSFSQMPEVIEDVEKRVGKLTNARLEVEHEMQFNGIILESESGLLDGSVKAQFDSIDNVFRSVNLNPQDNTEEAIIPEPQNEEDNLKDVKDQNESIETDEGDDGSEE